MKKFTSKAKALQYCFDNLKPSIVGLDNYNRFRQTKKRFTDDPSSLKSNAISSLFELFGIEEECTYKATKELDELL